MTDIIKRLRNWASWPSSLDNWLGPKNLAQDCSAAADEIERLRGLSDDRENLAIANARLWDELRLAQGCHHIGYLIGVHWMTSAYGRICAGEDEATVMADYGYRRADQPDVAPCRHIYQHLSYHADRYCLLCGHVVVVCRKCGTEHLPTQRHDCTADPTDDASQTMQSDPDSAGCSITNAGPHHD